MDSKTISNILNELGEDREDYFNAVAPPIVQTSNFAFTKVADFREALENESSSYIYSRGLNPTVEILSKKLAALDGAEASLVFNTGASAIFTAVLTSIKSGDHIVSVEKPYTWAQKMFNNILPRFNVTVTYVDGRNVENFENAIQHNTALIYLESPNSWSFYLQDLGAVARLAKSKKVVTICDNSYCTGIYQRPIELGIDMVLQSATKYINGHSDVVAGVLSGTKAMMTKIFNSEYMNMGSGIMPFNAWLLIRGLRTLQIRLSRISNTTEKVVNYLKGQEKVEDLSFPFDKDFPQYDLAKKQMQGACGLLSFYLKTSSIQQIETFCESLQHIIMAVSWGGYESLIMPACTSIKEENFDVSNKEQRQLRMYVGLEDAEYIIEGLQRGFDAIK